MYCLTMMYRYGSQVKLRDVDQDKLRGYAEEAQRHGLLEWWRVVHVDAGKMIDYWKEGEHGHS